MFRMSKAMLAIALMSVVSMLHAGELLEVTGKVIPNEYIVVFKTDFAPGLERAASVNAAAARFNARVEKVYENVLNGALMSMDKRRASAMANDPSIAFIEPNQIFYANETWGLDHIDQRNLPLDNVYSPSFDGTGIHAYIIDTGVRAGHVDFSGRMGNGYDAIDGDNNPNDCNGHGTHVAGTVGGSTWGVAKNVTIHGVRVLDCNGSGSTAGVIAGVDWVANNHISPAVANMSLGGGASTALDNAVNNAVAAGVFMAVAAGNENQNACNVSPARAADAYTVGSTTSSDTRSSFSNFGTCVDIFAPGSSITSAWHTSNTATNTISGTSMASPHVAGVAALLLDEDSSLTPAQIASALTGNATSGVLSSIGSGSPNLLLYAENDGTTPPPPPTGGELVDGVSQGPFASSITGEWVDFYVDVPANTAELDIQMSGGSGDADLYVRSGSNPTTSAYDCRPYIAGNSENCNFANPAAGRWYVRIRTYSAYTGVNIVANLTAGGGGGTCSNSGSASNVSATTGNWAYYTYEVPSCANTLNVTTTGPNGDADLYLRYGSNPTTSSYNCRSWSSNSNESCTISNPTAGTWHIGIRAYSSFNGLTVTASHE